MAYEFSNSAIKASFVAGGDLSSAQYKFVKLDSDGEVVVAAATTDRPVGVLQNAPSSGQIAEVTIAGGSKVVAGGNASVGNPVFTSASATAVTATVGSAASTFYVLGTFLEDAAAGQIVSAVVNCANSGRGA
jgi:hypothetical protein